LCGTPVITTRATAMWEETIYGISVEPLQWIARMDFNSGWYLPDSKGISKALDVVMNWTEDERKEKFQKAKPILIANYSNEAIIASFRRVFSEKFLLNDDRQKAIDLSSSLRMKRSLLLQYEAEMKTLVERIQKTYRENLACQVLKTY